jgi:UMF1 family MFS transporter
MRSVHFVGRGFALNRRTIFSWCLYDFANSFYVVLPAVVWQTYFQRSIVGNEQGQGDLWWGRAISFSMFLVAVTSPLMGAIADRAGVRKHLLVTYTLISVSAVCLFPTVEKGMVLWGFAVTVLSYFTFEGALVFYNAYLPEIAPPEYQGRVSGWGFGVGYAGSLLGLVLAYPLVKQGWFDAVWLSIAAAYLLFSLPSFLHLPRTVGAAMGAWEAARAGARESWQTFREMLRMPAMRGFLGAYFFYEDGVNTVIYFAAGFATQSLGFSDVEAIALFAVVQICALAGAFLWSKPTDYLGPKRVVMLMLVQWSLVVIAAYVVASPEFDPEWKKRAFWGVAVLAGTGLGAIQAASRAFMSALIPKGDEAKFFAFYSLVGKSAAIIGPLLFGGVSAATGGNQRAAILSVMALYIIGAALLSFVKAGGPNVRAEAGR